MVPHVVDEVGLRAQSVGGGRGRLVDFLLDIGHVEWLGGRRGQGPADMRAGQAHVVPELVHVRFALRVDLAPWVILHLVQVLEINTHLGLADVQVDGDVGGEHGTERRRRRHIKRKN